MKLRELEVWEMQKIIGGGWMSAVNPETGDQYIWFEAPDRSRSSVRVESDAYKPPSHYVGSISCCSGNVGPIAYDFPVVRAEIRATADAYFISYEQMSHNLYRAGERSGW